LMDILLIDDIPLDRVSGKSQAFEWNPTIKSTCAVHHNLVPNIDH
jgi:hypothetical protein